MYVALKFVGRDAGGLNTFTNFLASVDTQIRPPVDT
jgi:hypothetical protein